MPVIIDPDRTRGPVPAMRGVYLGDSPQPFEEEDVARLKAEVGVTCIRYGMEPLTLTDDGAEVYHEEGFARVGRMLDWCSRHDIGCVLDLHNAPGRLYGGDPRLWRETAYQDRFVALWERIARRFADHPAVAAWEPLNEPEPPDSDFDVWNRLHRRATDAIRRFDSERAVIVDSIGYARPECFAGLQPGGDPRVVYSFHNYQPGPYHCQKRRELRDRSTYYYPGAIPHRRPEGDPQDFNLAHFEPTEGRFWNRRALFEEWRDVFAFRDRHRVPLFCGEFGCVSDVPEMTDMVYLMDEISLFQEEGIHWTLYNTMYRTDDPYWKDRFDCGLYIYFSPERRLYRFSCKIALMEFFCRTGGEALDAAQPEDEWVGLYGVRRPDGGAAVLLSNKDRQERKEIALEVQGLPARWTAALSTMERGDGGFVDRGGRVLENGALRLAMPPLSLALLRVPAVPRALWARRLNGEE